MTNNAREITGHQSVWDAEIRVMIPVGQDIKTIQTYEHHHGQCTLLPFGKECAEPLHSGYKTLDRLEATVMAPSRGLRVDDSVDAGVE